MEDFTLLKALRAMLALRLAANTCEVLGKYEIMALNYRAPDAAKKISEAHEKLHEALEILIEDEPDVLDALNDEMRELRENFERFIEEEKAAL